jgi:hypothetical protein
MRVTLRSRQRIAAPVQAASAATCGKRTSPCAPAVARARRISKCGPGLSCSAILARSLHKKDPGLRAQVGRVTALRSRRRTRARRSRTYRVLAPAARVGHAIHGAAVRGRRQVPTGRAAQSSICAPISITRSAGMLKNLVAGCALRDMNANRLTRQRAIPGRLVATKFSRPRKKVVCSTV